MAGQASQLADDGRQYRDGCQEDGAYEGDSRHYAVQIFHCCSARTDAGDESAVRFHVLRYFHRVECDRCIEVSEEDAEAIAADFEETYDDLDVEVYAGKQPVYHYIISVE